jgi:hypothetical protein
MVRILFAIACLLSLLVGSAAAVVTAHSRQAYHSIVWRTDAWAEAEGAHPSLERVWREFRERGDLPGMRAGRRVRRRQVTTEDVLWPKVSAVAVTREYASLVVADGVVEYRRYPEPPCQVPI